jgi:Plasmid pRiA4b ORF-3-like protein
VAAWLLARWQDRGMAAARRITARTRIFQLKVQLREVRPPVWRRVLVPGEMSLAELHEVLQVAMGWTDSHRAVRGARSGLGIR